jgi:branched-chain amino acid transport system substrate-binding protein
MRTIHILTGAALAFALHAGAALAADTVRVGVIYPLTGPVAQPGKDVLAAVKVAQDIINNKHDLDLPLAATEGLPNLGGAMIELVVADHQGKPEIGRGEAERLITSENVVAIFGAYHSSVSAAASNVTERMQIPYLTGESSSPKLHTRGFEWFFRTGPHDGHYTRTMFDFVRDFEKAKGVKLATAAIIHEDTQFGVDSARVQEELAKEAGIEVLEKIAYRAKTTSLISEVQRLKAADADILFPTSYTADALLLMRTMKELDYAPRIIIAQNAGFNDATFLETIGADSEGIISRSPFSMDMAEKIPLIAQLNELYKKHNDDRDIFDPPIRSFVGALVLFEAINRAGSTEPGAIRDALRATSFPAGAIPMPWQDISFGPDGQNNGVSTALIQVQDGTYYSIYPFEVAAREVVYPFKPWSER